MSKAKNRGIPNYYHVKVVKNAGWEKQDVVMYGILDYFSDTAKKEYKKGNYIVEHAITGSMTTIPMDMIIKIQHLNYLV